MVSIDFSKRLVFLDVETNGLNKRKMDILQYGGISTKPGSLALDEIENEYFEASSPIDAQAMFVHKLFPKLLNELTTFRFFEEFHKESHTLDAKVPTIYVAHNGRFDLDAINIVLENYGIDAINFGPTVKTLEEANKLDGDCFLDSLPYFRDVLKICEKGSSSLGALAKRHKVDSPEIASFLENLLRKQNSKVHNVGLHNAIYDSFIVYLIMYKFRNYLV